MRLTRYIVSNSQLPPDGFPHLEVARVTGRDTQLFFTKILVDRNGQQCRIYNIIHLERHRVHTYYARTLREHRLIARSQCHRSPLRPATYHRRYKPSLPFFYPQRGVLTASHFCFYHPVNGAF